LCGCWELAEPLLFFLFPQAIKTCGCEIMGIITAHIILESKKSPKKLIQKPIFPIDSKRRNCAYVKIWNKIGNISKFDFDTLVYDLGLCELEKKLKNR